MQSKNKKKWIKRSIILGIILIFTIVFFVMKFNRPADSGYENETAKISDIATYYSFSGEIEAEEKRQMLAEASYKITKFHVKEGDIVQPGDVLYEIDNSGMQAQLEQAAAAVSLAQVNYDNAAGSGAAQQLNAAKSSLDSARLNYENAQKNTSAQQITAAQSALDSATAAEKNAQAQLEAANRGVKTAQDAVDDMQILFEAGAIAKNELDAAKTQLDTAKTQQEQAQTQHQSALSQKSTAQENLKIAKSGAQTAIDAAKLQLDQAQKNYNLVSGSVIASNLEAARAQLEQAKASYELVKAQITSGEITAKIKGKVTEIYANENTMLAAGTPVLDIVDYDALNAVVKVDEYDLGAIEEGKTVRVLVSALDLELEGVTRRLTQQTDAIKNITYFKAKIALPYDARLLEGMSVEAQALNQSAAGVITISMRALQFDNENKPYVFIKEGDKITTRPVEIGINNGLSVEIKEGLSDGETVYYPRKVIDMTAMTGARSAVEKAGE